MFQPTAWPSSADCAVDCYVSPVDYGVNSTGNAQPQDKSNKLGKGVRKVGNRYKARISIPGQGTKHIGSFETAAEAAQAYEQKHAEIHGDLPGSVSLYQCNECGQWLTSGAALSMHEKAHANDRVKKRNLPQNLPTQSHCGEKIDLLQFRTKSQSGYKGVRQVGCRYKARINTQQGLVHLGYFGSAEEAATAYAKSYFKSLGVKHEQSCSSTDNPETSPRSSPSPRIPSASPSPSIPSASPSPSIELSVSSGLEHETSTQVALAA